MAIVYRARDRELGRDVALKLLAAVEDSAQGNTRLLREAQALAQLAHPNVIHIYDVGRYADGVFLAMELVEGQRLDAWIRERRRSVDEVLRVFRGAARGLGAAHARGIVHRDFKPSNLILGSDGRVRVLDFGLARAADAPDLEGASRSPQARGSDSPSGGLPQARLADRIPPTAKPRHHDGESTSEEAPTENTQPVTVEEDAPRQPLEGASSTSLLDSPLTQEGALVGTPPYMAPEQHHGHCDARSDQFSFCIALWFALYGERPFSGLNFEDLKATMAAGRTRPVPPGRNVPAWVHKILVRGLQPNPAARFPTMEHVLVELERDPAQRRRRLLLAAGVLLLAVVGAFGWWRGPAACGGAERKLSGVWDAARRRQVEKTFTATGKPFAADAFAALSRALDGYAAAWVSMHSDACEATRVRGEQSAELLDLRMECLAERLEELRAQTAELAAADAEVVERAPSIAFSLPPLAPCADAAQLRAPVRPPADTRRVESLRKQLAQVRALWISGRYPQADSPSQKAVADAQSIGYKPALAEALLLEGRVGEARGRYAAAERSFRDARVAAESGRVDEVAAQAAIGLVWVVGEREGHYAEARELGREAQAKIERLGDNGILRADLESKLSAVSLEEGKFDDALQHAESAVALREKALAPGDPALAAAIIDRADVLQQLGRYQDAIADYRRALASYETSLGSEHPAMASLLVNYGDALRNFEKRDEALEQFRRAQKVAERSLGPQHPLNATIAVDLGALQADSGDLDGAVRELARARELWERTLGADHANVATCDFRLGEVAMKRRRPEEAALLFQRALDGWQKKLGPDHPSLSAALDGLGDALLEQHRAGDAAARYQRALTILENSVGPQHPDTVRTRELLARVRKSTYRN
jgi:serine/threonine protein kinase/tetratricopeptide (TPR) repeat protein